MSEKNVKRAVGAAVLALAAAALVWAWQVRREEGVSQAPVTAGLESGENALRAAVRENFEQSAAELNRMAQEPTDEPVALRLVDVGEGPSLAYWYRVDTARMDFDPAEVRRRLGEQTCAVPEMRDYMPYGVHYIFIYVDGGDRELLRARVDEDVCRALETAAEGAAGREGGDGR